MGGTGNGRFRRSGALGGGLDVLLALALMPSSILRVIIKVTRSMAALIPLVMVRRDKPALRWE